MKVNGSAIMSLHLFTPRPAWGLSGTGEEGTAETLRFFTNPRVVGVENGFALHCAGWLHDGAALRTLLAGARRWPCRVSGTG